MKIWKKLHPIKALLSLAMLIASACSPNMGEVILDQPNQQVSQSGQEPQSPIVEFIPTEVNLSPSEGMLLFEGSVFVASTKPLKGRWQLAGWQIASRSMAISDDQVPVDCTLYPHQGVENQWIGSCSGTTFIPKDGASNIAVMHTPPGGNTILVQVAPTPDIGMP
jgi:hypothetical protein